MPNTSQIQQLYIAYYGRPADPGGLDYWVGRLEENGGNLGEVISAFATSDEFEDRFGSLTEEELVNNMYQQILGRPAEPEGLEFYVGMLARGDSSLIELALDITNGAGGTDAITIQNRVEVANTFTQDLAERGLDYGTIEAAGQLVAGVSSETNVAEYIQSAVNELLDTLPAAEQAGPGEDEAEDEAPSTGGGGSPGGGTVPTPSEPEEEPGDEEPGDEEPGDEEPGDEEPGDEEPGDEEPGDEEPGDEEPGDEEPGDEEPGDEEPGDEEQDKATLSTQYDNVIAGHSVRSEAIPGADLSAAPLVVDNDVSMTLVAGDGLNDTITIDPIKTTLTSAPNQAKASFSLVDEGVEPNQNYTFTLIQGESFGWGPESGIEFGAEYSAISDIKLNVDKLGEYVFTTQVSEAGEGGLLAEATSTVFVNTLDLSGAKGEEGRAAVDLSYLAEGDYTVKLANLNDAGNKDDLDTGSYSQKSDHVIELPSLQDFSGTLTLENITLGAYNGTLADPDAGPDTSRHNDRLDVAAWGITDEDGDKALGDDLLGALSSVSVVADAGNAYLDITLNLLNGGSIVLDNAVGESYFARMINDKVRAKESLENETLEALNGVTEEEITTFLAGTGSFVFDDNVA